jgi:hypothetical protein
MPEISRFYGIVIQMYFGDHPPAHFHARYAGQTAKIAIDHWPSSMENFRHERSGW